MQYRTLGRTGVQVSTLVLGAMNFGRVGNTRQSDASAIVGAALDAGINLIDTADMYSNGESEEMVGRAIAGRREDVVLATKATLPMGEDRNHQGGSRPGRAGLEPARFGLALRSRAGRPRGHHQPLGPDAAALRPRGPGQPGPAGGVERLAKVADQAGLTMIQLALGFATAHRAVTSVIIGPRTLDHLTSQLAAADTVLPADVLDAIDEIVAPGVDLAPDEKIDTPPSLLDPAHRRR